MTKILFLYTVFSFQLNPTQTMNKSGLEQAINRGQVWRGRHFSSASIKGLDTGFPTLNQALADGGWPADGVTEIGYRSPGLGEVSLLFPALAPLSHQDQWILWVAPPYPLYAPALINGGLSLYNNLIIQPQSRRDLLWSIEESLKSSSSAAVLAWPQSMRPEHVRRLQIIAAQQQKPCFLFQDKQYANSPSSLRVRLNALSQGGLCVEILKQRRGWMTAKVAIDSLHSPSLFRQPSLHVAAESDAHRERTK
ncbi:translesion DNA synthesis-associated protein ImuA [Hahella aquimaris]|uniref:translesion DNA synthesis-associated protein ImuA n=1 Tax=Hahella sp. HNIBRBA332 TaxID=3015983 RepID=UPI00273C8D91|nr:translesion DNA synthesis-associated protein ImuA [Hahella sp. HNIBRBA332]WLQ11251.1 translesion DNA synthesis-associated protein ImuA [Hahella sp. HNIBRBA332]